MAKIELPATLTAEVDITVRTEWPVYTVVLKFGDTEIARWSVSEPDGRWYDRDYHDEVLEEFVAAKFAALFQMLEGKTWPS